MVLHTIGTSRVVLEQQRDDKAKQSKAALLYKNTLGLAKAIAGIVPS